MNNYKTKREQQLLTLRQRIRSHDALYGSQGDAKEDQCERILRATSRRLSRYFAESYADRQHAYGQRLLQTYA